MSALTQEIVIHIFSKLGVGKNLHSAYYSIMNDNFLLDKKLCLLDEEGKEVYNQMWSCKVTIEEKDFRLLLADCSVDGFNDFSLMVSLQDSPMYGCYFSLTDREANHISCSLNGFWVPATTYMQAAFLTGMEQIKDLSQPWQFNDKIDDLYEKLIEFITTEDTQ